MSDLIKEARNAQRAVYLATEQSVAADLSRIIGGLVDRIEALEAERDTYREDSFTGQSMHAQWQERAERAEARLARVTDDSMAERLREVLDDETWARTGRSLGDIASGHVAQAALALVRAVAAGEQSS